MSWKNRIINFLEENRGLVILFFCLPGSVLFDFLLSLNNFVQRKLFGSAKNHEKNVQKVQQQVQNYNKLYPKSPNRKLLCTARPNWLSLSTTFYQKNECHKIDVKNLFNILELDEDQLTIRVEPMVTVNEITKFLIPKGFTLAVTLEIGDATLGGLAMGTGMTTHSHIVGLYQESILSYEVILGDGSFLRASKQENLDLYQCLPWSHGSLAFLVALTLKLVKIKPYIKLTYIPIKGQKNYCDMLRILSGDTSNDYPVPNYLEATIFSKNEAVIMAGDYSEYDKNLPINTLSRWYKPWFYKYVQEFLTLGKHTELIPIRDYLLRHNRAIFWIVEDMIPFANHPIFRLIFGWMLPPKPAFLKFSTTPKVRAFTFCKQVFQDIVLPIRKLEQQIDKSIELFDTFPLLVYPCRVYVHDGQIRSPKQEDLISGTNYAMYNDLGIYGVPGPVKCKKSYNSVTTMREMEKFTREINGFSFLYADIFMTRAEFAEMFDLSLYEIVRKKYCAENAFPHLYDKIKPEIDLVEIAQKFSDN